VKQLKVNLPTDLRAKLEASSKAADRTLADEIRQRLEQTFQPIKIEPHLRELIRLIRWLAILVKSETGHDWYNHPARLRIFEEAIAAYFKRLKASPPLDGKPEFAPGELPEQQMLPSDKLQEKGVGLEVIAHFIISRRGTGPLSDDDQDAFGEMLEQLGKIGEEE
jgi:hypothetical protein